MPIDPEEYLRERLAENAFQRLLKRMGSEKEMTVKQSGETTEAVLDIVGQKFKNRGFSVTKKRELSGVELHIRRPS